MKMPTKGRCIVDLLLILWTALSLALGLEIRGEIIRGVPCIKRYHQLFCPTPGSNYPRDRIESFIDENKALMKRMYGEFQRMGEYSSFAREIFEEERTKRTAEYTDAGSFTSANASDDGFTSESRHKRQTTAQRYDACESKTEIITPYWAANSVGRVRAIVNTQHFEQAIHQEVCAKLRTKRCHTDCACEQKYKWHRLLAYDPDNDCQGIFMDWFLFPSCCLCRCLPLK